jgi:hypothetical protein
MGELLPFAWQRKHTAALPVSVVLCLSWLVGSQADGCGEKTPAPWQPAVFKQVCNEVPPVKSLPWQVWQVLNPDMVVAFGAAFA